MLALIYLAVMFVLGDSLCSRFYRYISLPHRIAASLFVGLLISSWITYLGALILAQTSVSNPLFGGNLLFFLIATVVIFFTRRFPRSETDGNNFLANDNSVSSDKWDWILIGSYLVFVSCLMFTTLGSSENKLWVSSRHWSDFGPNTAVMQNFVFGRNFPPENPHYTGELMRHHFLFWFQAGNLEYLGFDPAWSVNILSVLTMVGMLMLVMVLGEVLFNSRVVGRIASALFFFSGSLAYLTFLRQQNSLANAFANAFELRRFLNSGFPYLGEDWGLWTVDVFLQQRHFASGIGILLLILIFLIERYRKRLQTVKSPPSESLEESTVPPETFRNNVWGFVFSGVLIGLLPFWNSAVFLAAFAILGCWFLLFSEKRYLLCLAVTTALVSFAQLSFMRSGGAKVAGYPKFHWGYVVADPTVARVVEFLGFSIGFKWFLIALALTLVSWFHRRVLIAVSSLLFIAFFVQFNPDILANHKFINIWLLIVNLFVAYGLWRLWQGAVIKQKVVARILTIILIIGITFGGLIDFFPIYNDRGFADMPFKNDSLITWLRTETEPSDIFLSNRYVSHQILLAGRRVFYGWPYYAQSAGLPVTERDRIYRIMFEGRDPEQIIRLLNENHVSFVAIDDDLRINNDFIKNLNEDLYRKYFEQVFTDSEKHFKNMAIYRVPTVEEGHQEFESKGAQIDLPKPIGNVFKGGKGKQNGEFEMPHGIAVDNAGNIFVADTGNARIQKFSAEGDYLATFGDGICKSPNGIAVDKSGNIYVADGVLNRVLKFKSTDFALLLETSAPDQGFFGPSDISVDSGDNIYVVDQGWARIVKFDKDGKFLTTWGKKGSNDGEFDEPTGIDISEQRVYIADSRNARIQVFDTSGKFINKWLVAEWPLQQTGWQAPDVLVDKKTQRLYVSSTNSNEVIVFEKNGRRLQSLKLTSDDKLDGPTTLAFGKDKQLWILNTLSSNISIANIANLGIK